MKSSYTSNPTSRATRTKKTFGTKVSKKRINSTRRAKQRPMLVSSLSPKKETPPMKRNVKTKKGSSRLHKIARSGSTQDLLRSLTKETKIDELNKSGNTPLCESILHDNIQVACKLIHQGANVHFVHKTEKTTPLHFACAKGMFEVVKLLLDKNADIHVKDNEGNTPLHVAAYNKGTFEIVQYLIKRGANVNAKNAGGNTPIHFVHPKKSETLEYLLDHGAQFLPNCYMSTPLHTTMCLHRTTLIRCCLEKAKVSDLNAQDIFGRTILHYAIKHNHLNVARILIEKEININIQDKQGYSALHWAMFYGTPEWIQLLLDHGADITLKTKLGWGVLDEHVCASSWNYVFFTMYLKKITSTD